MATARTTFGGRSYSQPAPVRPIVLVVTNDPNDANRVAETVIPRRYEVLYASSCRGAKQMLQSNAARIGVIVVGEKSAEERGLVKLAQGLAPEAKVIRLPTNYDAADIVSQLIAVI